MRPLSRLAAPFFLALLTIHPALLHAQLGRSDRPRLRCTVYDSLMAGIGHSDPGAASEQGLHGSHLIQIVRGMSISDRDHGITDVGFVVSTEAGAPWTGASVEIMINLQEPIERPIEERQTTLLLDDSTRIDLGTLAQTPGATFPNGVKTWYLFGFAPKGSLLALARAQTIRLTVGTTRWDFPADLLARLRGGLAALTCPN